VSQRFPLTPLIETLRSLLMGTPIGANGWWSLGWVSVILVASVICTTLLFRRRAGRR
jgi:ABC-2 type transport system permease protein